jgi:hypothetical protein
VRVLHSLFVVLFLCLASSGLYGSILVFSGDGARNPAIAAVDSLGLSYTLTTYDNFESDLNGSDWELVIVESPMRWNLAMSTALASYINSGGKAMMSMIFDFPALMSAFEVGGDSSTSGSLLDVHPWEFSHPIFHSPNPDIGTLTSWDTIWSINVRLLDPVGSAVALAGFSPTPESGMAAIILGNNGRTLYNSFNWDNIATRWVCSYSPTRSIFYSTTRARLFPNLPPSCCWDQRSCVWDGCE